MAVNGSLDIWKLNISGKIKGRKTGTFSELCLFPVSSFTRENYFRIFLNNMKKNPYKNNGKGNCFSPKSIISIFTLLFQCELNHTCRGYKQVQLYTNEYRVTPIVAMWEASPCAQRISDFTGNKAEGVLFPL